MLKNTIGVTERAAFKVCRRMHDYEYRQNLVPASEHPSAMWFGRLVHYALAQYYRDGTWEEALDYWLAHTTSESIYSVNDPEISSLREMAVVMITGYITWAQKIDAWEVIAVEPTDWNIKIQGTRGKLSLHPDLVVRMRGKLWVVDHKTVASFRAPGDLVWDDQMTAYLFSLREKYGEVPAGAIYNQLRKKIPATPQVLKSGALSKDKSIDTTHEVYLAAIKANNLLEEDYSEVLERLKMNQFYKREVIARNPAELDNFQRQLVQEFREMVSRSTPRYPNKTHDCSWRCSYKMLCQAQDEGGDVQALIDHNYKQSAGRML